MSKMHLFVGWIAWVMILLGYLVCSCHSASEEEEYRREKPPLHTEAGPSEYADVRTTSQQWDPGFAVNRADAGLMDLRPHELRDDAASDTGVFGQNDSTGVDAENGVSCGCCSLQACHGPCEVTCWFGSGIPSYHTALTYESSLLTKAETTGENGAIQWIEDYFYGENELLARTELDLLGDGSVNQVDEYQYSPSGLLLHVYRDAQGDGLFDERETYVYDADTLVLVELHGLPEGQLLERLHIQYTEEGLIAAETLFDDAEQIVWRLEYEYIDGDVAVVTMYAGESGTPLYEDLYFSAEGGLVCKIERHNLSGNNGQIDAGGRWEFGYSCWSCE